MVHVHVHVHNLHCTIIFMLILGQSHIRINMHTLPFLQAINVLNHAGVCVSYQTAWKYVQQLTTEARYQEAVHSGHWQWVFDNVNMHQRVRHEREGTYMYFHVTFRLHTFIYVYTCTSCVTCIKISYNYLQQTITPA